MARVRHGEGRRLPDGPARRRAPDERGRRRDLPAGALGAAVQPHARRPDRAAPVRRPHAQPRRGAGHARVLRGRPHRPHDPADAVPTVRQTRRAVLQRVLLPGPAPRRGGADRGRRRVRTGHRRAPCLPRQVRDVRDRRLRPDVPGHVERARAHRRRPLGRLPPGHPARGHGVLPVPSDGAVQAGDPAERGRARRGRDRVEQGRRAVHGTLRAHDQGPGPARRRVPVHLPGDQGGSRRGPARRHGLPGPAAPRPQGDRGEAPRHHRVRARLPARRADDGARPDPADRALRHGRHPHRSRRARRDRRRRDAGAGPLRGGRMRMRERPRCQPPGDELAPGHRRVRPPWWRAHGGVREGHRSRAGPRGPCRRTHSTC